MTKLLKYAVVPILCIAVCVTVVFIVRGTGKKGGADVELLREGAGDEELADYAQTVLKYLKNRDYDALAAVAHPEYGVVFSPYPTVSLSSANCFSPKEISGFDDDRQRYAWGIYDGSGLPIEMTVEGYFERFVMDVDFTKSSQYSVNEVSRSGNALENVKEVFPNGSFVDFYMPGQDMDINWRSLKLVFESYEGALRLTAVIHGENTI